MEHAPIRAQGATLAAFAGTFDRKALAAVMTRAKRIIEARNSIPILDHVLLSIDAAGGASVTATDLDIWTTERLACEHAAPGTVTVGCKALLDALKKAKGDKVRLQSIGSHLSLIAVETGAMVRLGTLPVADYPLPGDPIASDVAAFSLDANTLYSDIARLQPAISTEKPRYYLNGIFLHATHDQAACDEPVDVLRLVATDGHRLGRITRPVPTGAETVPDAILPTKFCNILKLAIGAKGVGDVQLRVSKTKVEATFGNIVILSRLIDGTFPDYTRVIPTRNDKRLSIESSALADAVDSVASICTSKTRAVGFSIGSGWLVASASDPTNGRAATVIENIGWTEDEFTIGFNARYVGDICKAFGDVALTVDIADAAAPTRFESPDMPELTYVQMPLRVDVTVLSPDDVRKLNRTPDQAFAEDAPGIVARLQEIATDENIGTYARKEQLQKFGALARAYVAHLGGDRMAHLTVAREAAALRGDDAAAWRACLEMAALRGKAMAPVQKVQTVEQVKTAEPVNQVSDRVIIVSHDRNGARKIDPAVIGLGEIKAIEHVETKADAEPVEPENASETPQAAECDGENAVEPACATECEMLTYMSTDMLADILAELKALRSEVAELRASPNSASNEGAKINMGDRKNSPERLKIEIASLTEDRDYYERKAKERKLELQVVRAKRKSAVILARKRKPASLRAVDCERADAAEARVRLLTREIESLQRGNLLASVARIPVVPVSYNRIAA